MATPTSVGYFLKSRSRPEIEALIPHEVEKILEVGCGIGSTGKLLAKSGSRYLVGLDISPEALQLAKQSQCYHQLIECNLEIEPIPSTLEGVFDCILYPDVLEHLRDPWTILRLHRTILTKNGVVIASIPNIRWYGVIGNLVLRGKWTYTEMGILDKSHLRFFTKSSMIDLFQQCGFDVVKIDPLIKAHSWLKWLNKILWNKLDGFLALQYLVVAHKHTGD